MDSNKKCFPCKTIKSFIRIKNNPKFIKWYNIQHGFKK